VPLTQSDLALADPQDDVRGLTVLDPDGHRVGEVHDLVVDEGHRRARFLVVTSGGVLGLGRARRFVPVDLVTRVDQEHVYVARDHRDVHDDPTSGGGADDAAEYDPQLIAAELYADVYAYYGFTPFWGMDYVTPYFHRR